MYEIPFFMSLCLFIVKFSVVSKTSPEFTIIFPKLPITEEKFLFVEYIFIPLLSLIKISKLFFIAIFSNSCSKSSSLPEFL